MAWVYAPGSYAERVSVPADALVPIPDTIDDRTAASVMMQGPVQPGDVALVHAAAGGVGLLLTQYIKLRGGHVIGRLFAQDKAAASLEAGADHVIVVQKAILPRTFFGSPTVKASHVVYDGSGPTSFQGSLDSLRRSGTFCWYGPVLGGPGPLDIMSLPKSIKLFDHIHTPELLRARSNQLFEWVEKGVLKVKVGGTCPLSDAARAHADIEARAITGKLLLIP